MKKIFLGLLFLLSGTAALAQREEQLEIVKERKHVLQIGPKIGATLTSMGQPTQCRLYEGSGIGFSSGVALRARFGTATENSDAGTGLLGIGLEAKYKQNGVKTNGVNESGEKDARLSIGYLEVPILAQFFPLYKNSSLNGLYIEAGLDIAGALSKSPDILTVYPNNQRYDRVAYHIGDLKGFDLRIPVGVGYTFRKGFDINLRYYIGTSDLAENMACKMNSFEISLAWLFKVIK